LLILFLLVRFEFVLSTLEDVVTDAPRAPEYLGRIFAKAITEHVASLKEIGQLIHDGGEESSSRLQIGLSADILGSTLEVIQTEKGDAFLNEIQTSSNLQLQTFRPPEPIKSRKLEKFL
jgi:translation initiation factor 4G